MPTVYEDEESNDGYMLDDGDDIDTNHSNNSCENDIQANNSRRSEIVKEIYIYEIQWPIHIKRRNALSQYEVTGDESDDKQYEGEEDENGAGLEWANDNGEY